MDYKLFKNIAIFFIIFLLFIFSINLGYLHFSGSNEPAGRNTPAVYVYSPSDIRTILEENSLSNFSGISSYPWVADKIEEVHSKLLKNNCSVPGMAEAFYRSNITVFSPTLAYMEYAMFECQGEGVIQSERIHAESALSLYKKQFIKEDTTGLSPRRALGELLVYWQTRKEGNSSIELTNEVILPYLGILNESSAEERPVRFGLSNISILRDELKKECASDERTLKGTLEGYMAFNGLIELNESEKFYSLGYLSAAYWHYCLALGYYNISRSRWADVPAYGLKNIVQTQRDHPYNITGIRNTIYAEAIRLFNTSNRPYKADLFAMYILQDIYGADKYLWQLTNHDRFLPELVPLQVYERYLMVGAEVRGARIFERTFDS